MKCENCGIDHDGEYGSGRFCSAKCARGFSTKSKRKEINEKVSRSLTGRKGWNLSASEERKVHKCGHCDKGFVKKSSLVTHERFCLDNPDRVEREKAWDRKRREAIENTSFEDLPQPWRRYKILIDQDGCCNRCGIKKWNGELITFELEHKDGNNQNNSRENLELLCPNCHSQTKTWRGRKLRKNRVLISDKDFVKALTENSNIRQALISLKLRPTGNNYYRAHRIIDEYEIEM